MLLQRFRVGVRAPRWQAPLLRSSRITQCNLLAKSYFKPTLFPSAAQGAIQIYFGCLLSLSRALHLRGHSSAREAEPFATLILGTSDHDKVDDRTRSKWSRVLRCAAEFKDPDEPLRDFITRKGGINECAAQFARRLGRSSQY